MLGKHFYYCERKKIPLTLVKSKKVIKFENYVIKSDQKKQLKYILKKNPKSYCINIGEGMHYLNSRSNAPILIPKSFRNLKNSETLNVYKTNREEILIITEEIIIKFKPALSENLKLYILNKYKLSMMREDKDKNSGNLYRATRKTDYLKLCNELNRNKEIIYSSPNYRTSIKFNFTPNSDNSTKFQYQWALKNTGQFGGIVGEDLKITDAWDLTRGNFNIIIAILDTGVDPHPDLSITNQGYDAINDINGTMSYYPDNNDAHGTNCAGIIAGKGQKGIWGIAPNCRIMGIKIDTLADGFNPTPENVARALQYAVDNQARVINLSWHVPPHPKIIEKIKYALDHKCIICAAAGNDDADEVDFPANIDGVFAIVAHNNRGELISDSNQGPEVFLTAPGDRILTTDNNSNYISNFGGTSAACAFVSGVCALILSKNINLNAAQVKDILRKSAIPFKNNPQKNKYTGYGKVNAYKALKET